MPPECHCTLLVTSLCSALLKPLTLCLALPPSSVPPSSHSILLLPSSPCSPPQWKSQATFHLWLVPSLMLFPPRPSLLDTLSSAVSSFSCYKYFFSTWSSLLALNMLSHPHSHHLSHRGTSWASALPYHLPLLCFHCSHESVLILRWPTCSVWWHFQFLSYLTAQQSSQMLAISSLWSISPLWFLWLLSLLVFLLLLWLSLIHICLHLASSFFKCSSEFFLP